MEFILGAAVIYLVFLVTWGLGKIYDVTLYPLIFGDGQRFDLLNEFPQLPTPALACL